MGNMGVIKPGEGEDAGYINKDCAVRGVTGHTKEGYGAALGRVKEA